MVTGSIINTVAIDVNSGTFCLDGFHPDFSNGARIMIENKDCLEYLSTLEDDSVDLVVTDPPYFIGFDGGQGWDCNGIVNTHILNGVNSGQHSLFVYLNPTACLLCGVHFQNRNIPEIRKLQTTSIMLCSHHRMRLSGVTTGCGRSKTNFARKHEYAWCWSKGKELGFNDKEIRIFRKVNNKKYEFRQKSCWENTSLRIQKQTKEQIAEHKKIHIDPKTTFTDGTIPTCIWEKNNHTTSKDYCGWHPTTKNLEIMERIVRGYTLEGDTVLDIFMGSGSICHCCKTSRSQVYWM